MLFETKAWDWEIVKGQNEKKWKVPSQEVYYLINRWGLMGFKDILDLGCGIGRHSILFKQKGFNTYAMDLSQDAINKASSWAKNLNLQIDFKVDNMTNLPYDNEMMDAIFAYYVISHTDTKGVVQILKEIRRVLKNQGEVYLTFGSKDSWGYKSNWPCVDENTKIRLEDGPDNNVPHFFADRELIYDLFGGFEIIDLKQIIKIEKNNDVIKDHHHYHVLAKKI